MGLDMFLEDASRSTTRGTRRGMKFTVYARDELHRDHPTQRVIASCQFQAMRIAIEAWRALGIKTLNCAAVTLGWPEDLPLIIRGVIDIDAIEKVLQEREASGSFDPETEYHLTLMPEG